MSLERDGRDGASRATNRVVHEGKNHQVSLQMKVDDRRFVLFVVGGREPYRLAPDRGARWRRRRLRRVSARCARSRMRLRSWCAPRSGPRVRLFASSRGPSPWSIHPLTSDISRSLPRPLVASDRLDAPPRRASRARLSTRRRPRRARRGSRRERGGVAPPRPRPRRRLGRGRALPRAALHRRASRRGGGRVRLVVVNVVE